MNGPFSLLRRAREANRLSRRARDGSIGFIQLAFEDFAELARIFVVQP